MVVDAKTNDTAGTNSANGTNGSQSIQVSVYSVTVAASLQL